MSLVRIDRKISPDDVLRGDLEVASGHSKWSVVREDSRKAHQQIIEQDNHSISLSEDVSPHLRIKLDERGGFLLVLGVGIGTSENGLSVEQLAIGFGDFFSTPIDRVDLFAEETEEAELVRRSLLVRDVARDERAVRFEIFGRRSGEGVGLLRFRCLEDRLGGHLNVGGLGGLELGGGGESSVVDIGKISQISRQPNSLHSSGNDIAEPHEAFRVEVLLSDSGDEDSLGLRESRVGLGDEEILTEDDEFGVFSLDEVEDVDWQYESVGESRYERQGDEQVRIQTTIRCAAYRFVCVGAMFPNVKRSTPVRIPPEPTELTGSKTTKVRLEQPG